MDRMILRMRLHFKDLKLHPIHMCEMIRMKFPETGDIKRGWVTEEHFDMACEHFYLENSKGEITDIAQLMSRENHALIITQDKPEGVKIAEDPQIQQINDSLWKKYCEDSKSIFKDWPRPWIEKKKKVLRNL